MSNQTVEVSKIREVLEEAIAEASRTNMAPTVDGLLAQMGVEPEKRVTLSITVPVTADTEDEIRREALAYVRSLYYNSELEGQLSIESV